MSTWVKMGQNGFKWVQMGSKWVQIGFKWVRFQSKWVQIVLNGFKWIMSSNGFKMGSNDFKWVQMGSKWVQMGSNRFNWGFYVKSITKLAIFETLKISMEMMEIYSDILLPKIREIDGFTKEVTKELFSRNFFLQE